MIPHITDCSVVPLFSVSQPLSVSSLFIISYVLIDVVIKGSYFLQPSGAKSFALPGRAELSQRK